MWHWCLLLTRMCSNVWLLIDVFIFAIAAWCKLRDKTTESLLQNYIDLYSSPYLTKFHNLISILSVKCTWQLHTWCTIWLFFLSMDGTLNELLLLFRIFGLLVVCDSNEWLSCTAVLMHHPSLVVADACDNFIANFLLTLPVKEFWT